MFKGLTIPEGKVVKIEVGGKVLWQIVEEPVVPDEPTPAATQYLYGRAAADGETPDVVIDGVGYKGAVLPKLPEWDEEAYPYAVMDSYGTEYRLYCLDRPLTEGFTNYFIHTKANCVVYYATATEWVFKESGTGDSISGSIVTFGSALWANHDISPIPISDPIPVYNGLVAYSYNGTVLPELPEVEGYPYKYALYHKYSVYRYEVIYGAEPITAQKDVGGYGACIISGSGYARKLYYLKDGVWYENDSYFSIAYKGDTGFQWTNHDILYELSTDVFLAKSSDPVPVYEKE